MGRQECWELGGRIYEYSVLHLLYIACTFVIKSYNTTSDAVVIAISQVVTDYTDVNTENSSVCVYVRARPPDPGWILEDDDASAEDKYQNPLQATLAGAACAGPGDTPRYLSWLLFCCWTTSFVIASINSSRPGTWLYAYSIGLNISSSSPISRFLHHALALSAAEYHRGNLNSGLRQGLNLGPSRHMNVGIVPEPLGGWRILVRVPQCWHFVAEEGTCLAYPSRNNGTYTQVDGTRQSKKLEEAAVVFAFCTLY